MRLVMTRADVPFLRLEMACVKPHVKFPVVAMIFWIVWAANVGMPSWETNDAMQIAMWKNVCLTREIADTTRSISEMISCWAYPSELLSFVSFASFFQSFSTSSTKSTELLNSSLASLLLLLLPKTIVDTIPNRVLLPLALSAAK